MIESGVTSNDISLQSAVSTRIAGLKLSPFTSGAACSIGFNVGRSGTSNRYLTTASHCTSTINQMDTDTLGQPYKNATSVAYEVSDPGTFTGGDCPSTKVCRYADAVLLQYLSAAPSTLGKIAWPALNSTNYTTTHQLSWGHTVVTGQALHLVGQASGRRAGTLLDDCEDVAWSDGVTWLCLMKSNYVSAGGDSGAPVVFWKAPFLATVDQPLGIHKGIGSGYKYFSSLDLAFDEFEDDLGSGTLCATFGCYGVATDTISVSISGPSEVPTNAGEACSWTASVSGAQGSVSYEWEWDYQVVSTEDFYASDEGTEDTYWLELMVSDTMFTDTAGMLVEVDDAYSCD